MQASDDTTNAPDLDAISEQTFVEGWKRIVGEPPAVMLEDRKEMVAMLVEGSPVAPCAWCWML